MNGLNAIKRMKMLPRRALCAALAALIASGVFTGCSMGKSETTPVPQQEEASPTPIITELPTAEATLSPTEPPTAAPSEPAVPTVDPEQHKRAEAFRNIELPIELKYDYFAIPDELIALMTDGDLEMYRRVAVAYFSGESEAEIPENIGEFPNLWRVIDMYFPLFFADVSDENIKQQGNKLVWEYSTSAEEHERTIREFEERIDELLAPVVESDSFIMQVLTVYKHFTSGIVYNGTGANGEPDNGTPHEKFLYRHSIDAIRDNTGVCWCFARAYNFLICQIGAQSLTVHGLRAGDSAIHEWTVFKYKGEWRYADPTWDSGGKTLNFFGFTIKSRGYDGYPEKDVSVLEGKEKLASEYFDVSDTFFSPLCTGKCSGDSYELDHESGKIVFYKNIYDAFGNATPKKNCQFDPETAEYENFEPEA